MVKTSNQNIETEKKILIRDKILASIAVSKNPQQVIEDAVKLLSEAADAGSVLIYVIDPETNRLVLAASNQDKNELIGKVSLAMGEGITGWVAEHNEIVQIPTGASKDPRFKKIAGLIEDDCESFLSIPCRYLSNTVGVINIHNSSETNYTDDEVDYLSKVATGIGSITGHMQTSEKLKSLQKAFDEQKLVTNAKKKLIKQMNLSEPDAYAFIRSYAMKSRISIAQAAEQLLSTELHK